MMNMSEPKRRRTRKEAIKAGLMRSNRRPPVPPITLTPKLAGVLVEIVVLLFVILVLTTVVNNKFSAQSAAETYFVNLVNGNYKAAYKMLDAEEDVFVNQETFSSYVKQFNYENISEYIVEGDGSESSDSAVSSKTASILYRNEGEESEQRFSVQMLKSEDKKMIFFDDWKVAGSSALCFDCAIVVRDGAQLTIDGKEVDSAYIDLGASDAEYYDTYRIPQIFQGNHTIEVSLDGMETIKQNMFITSGGSYNEYTNMYCTEETCKELQTLAVNNLYRIYDAAVKNKSFEEIASLFTSDADSLVYIQENYNYLVENLHTDIQVNSISFSNISAYGNTSSTYAEVSYSYAIDCMIQDWWSGNWERETVQGSEYGTFNFVKENGEWVQLDLSCNALY